MTQMGTMYLHMYCKFSTSSSSSTKMPFLYYIFHQSSADEYANVHTRASCMCPTGHICLLILSDVGWVACCCVTASTQKKEKKALKSIQLSINLAVLKHSHDSLGKAI